ncbi:MAG TPA: DUF2891 family protein [Actinomycetota bacterium]|nr:DUF2891 family protein [Actinomycetota bacterium]
MPRGFRVVVAVGLLCLLVLSTLAGPALGQKAPSTKSIWKRFAADRNTLYEELAPAFVSCFQRRDSLVDPLAPIFHGCLDWHSAVHAAYSHHVLYRRTGEQEYLDLAEAQIAPNGISLIPGEELYVRAKAPDYPLTENPYGFGWFLILARERELSTEQTDFGAMADFAVEQLTAWFAERASSGDAQNFILNRAHPNYSWSLINLSVWAKHTGDEEITAAVQEASKPLLEPGLDAACPLTLDQAENAGGFQPACLMRLAAVAHIWGKKATEWVTSRLPDDYYVPPVTDPSSCHAGGLNFTRAFALYQMYLLTGNTNYRDNYVELIRYHVSRPDLYMGEMYLGEPDYLCYSHWVAQVGVRSISESFERLTTPEADIPIE